MRINTLFYVLFSGNYTLELESIFSEKAKANLKQAGESYSPKEGSQNSAKVPIPIDTRQELAKAANVSHDTISRNYTRDLFRFFYA